MHEHYFGEILQCLHNMTYWISRNHFRVTDAPTSSDMALLPTAVRGPVVCHPKQHGRNPATGVSLAMV